MIATAICISFWSSHMHTAVVEFWLERKNNHQSHIVKCSLSLYFHSGMEKALLPPLGVGPARVRVQQSRHEAKRSNRPSPSWSDHPLGENGVRREAILRQGGDPRARVRPEMQRRTRSEGMV